MPMPPYPVYCYTPQCKNLAEYKIAARWSDGVVSELKTYALCCDECLSAWYQRSRERHVRCHAAAGETLDAPGIYRRKHGARDVQLDRLPERERELSGSPFSGEPKATADFTKSDVRQARGRLGSPLLLVSRQSRSGIRQNSDHASEFWRIPLRRRAALST